MRTATAALLILTAVLCPLTAAEALAGVNRTGISIADLTQQQLPTTCQLHIQGGNNETEIRIFGTSIANAQLTCSGKPLTIAVHPLLARFASGFKGVQLAPVYTVSQVLSGEAKLARNLSVCAPQTENVVLLCGRAEVTFVDSTILNVRADPLGVKNQQSNQGNAPLGQPPAGMTLTVIGTQSEVGFLRFVSPTWKDVACQVVSAEILDVHGGTVQHTTGVKGTLLMMFNMTQFTSNEGVVFGGAATMMAGRASFSRCVFDCNRAPTIAETTGGAGRAALLRSGLGGAVLGYQMGGFNATNNRTSLTFEGCIFGNNSAYEGGAIAAVGADLYINNCTFLGNRASKSGFDVHASFGGALTITNSNIKVTSDTVDWERTNASQCWRGELFDPMQGVCRKCLPSTFSLSPTSTCQPCPADAKCLGGDAILPNQGFWLAGNQSTKVVACPRASACLQGGGCAEGQEGVVCGACSKGYAPALPFRCVKCASVAAAIGIFVASFVVLLVSTGISIQLNLMAARERQENSDATAQKDPDAGDIVKLLALFVQYVSIIGSLPVPWSNVILPIFAASDWVFASATGHNLAWAASPFECVLKGLRVPSAVAKQLVYLCMPVFVAVVELLVFWAVYACCSRRTTRVLYITIVLLASAFFTFPMWVRAVFSFFSCVSVQDATLPYSLWWAQDMSQPCYHGQHKAWAFGLAVPCAIICCAAPVVLFVGLWRNSHKMTHANFHVRYGHLHRLYGNHAYGYEAVILAQTIALVAIAVFSTHIGSYAAVLLAGLHLAVSLQLLQVVRPYTNPLLQRIHVASLWCLLADVFVALLLFAEVAGAFSWSFGIVRTVVSAVVLVLNVGFTITCCVLTVRCFARSKDSCLSKVLARWRDKRKV